MSKPIRKAIFPVAGLGTRFLPATKAMPKEMLTVVDRPLIQYTVDEAREAGIEQIILVTGRGKSMLVDHFDVAYELEAVMRGRGFAYVHYKHNESYVAMGIEAALERASGRIKVERVACAFDCGQIINPDGARAQVEGSIIQTLSRVLMEEVRFDRSRVTSVDWNSYPILRFVDIPKIEIALIDRPSEPPVGAGEAACTTVGAALANAVFDASGARLRTVPFTPERVKAALSAV